MTTAFSAMNLTDFPSMKISTSCAPSLRVMTAVRARVASISAVAMASLLSIGTRILPHAPAVGKGA